MIVMVVVVLVLKGGVNDREGNGRRVRLVTHRCDGTHLLLSTTAAVSEVKAAGAEGAANLIIVAIGRGCSWHGLFFLLVSLQRFIVTIVSRKAVARERGRSAGNTTPPLAVSPPLTRLLILLRRDFSRGVVGLPFLCCDIFSSSFCMRQRVAAATTATPFRGTSFLLTASPLRLLRRMRFVVRLLLLLALK